MKLQRIHLHWHCFLKRPNHFWFHVKGVAREVEPKLWLELAAYATLLLAIKLLGSIILHP